MEKKKPILVVDDDTDDQELVTEILKLLEYDYILIFSNGQDVLSYLRTTEEQPFVILCDINLPLIDGLTLRKIINDEEYLRSKSIPFVFLSTSATRISVKSAYENGVQGFFQKPTSFDETKSLLKLILDYWQTSKHPNSM